jgi:orotidine-5'-phosphate decarboxylase
MGVPTDMSKHDCVNTYGGFPDVDMKAWLTEREEQYTRLAEKAENKPKGDHLASYAISSYDMLEMYKEYFPCLKLFTPGIRDQWMLGNLAGQKRTAGCVDALEAGASYIVLGNQLFKGDPDNGISAEYSQILTADSLSGYFRQF